MDVCVPSGKKVYSSKASIRVNEGVSYNNLPSVVSYDLESSIRYDFQNSNYVEVKIQAVK